MDSLVENLSILLYEKELVLACAESCTGGMLAAAITDRAGSSEIFDCGFITYSNQSKQDMLGVSAATLSSFGAVSAECASEMATGALNRSLANITVAITGIAGPAGGSAEKPVGLVYIAVASKGKDPAVFECHFEGSRTQIRHQAVMHALNRLIEMAETMP